MPHFIVTFRIKNDTSYDDRYKTFTKRADELALDGPWDETTSFLAFSSKSASATAESICRDLYLFSEFDATKDTMVVIDLDQREYATKGEINLPFTLSSSLGF